MFAALGQNRRSVQKLHEFQEPNGQHDIRWQDCEERVSGEQ